ncbi:MAG TPA: type II toxin-antitoxin system VapC family toxin [Verrucomicrobiae bacterium]|nr:type II toxin-antitoxin system VapC family toxin [Verrucomicrobiae bacterium]
MYLDTCVIVRLVSREPDSEAYHRIVSGHPVVTSELAVTEIRSALLMKERTGSITRAARQAGWRLFQQKVLDGEFTLLPLNRQVVERAGGVIEQCHPTVPLRSLDAIHVATAELHGGEEIFSSDLRVCDAARFLSLPLVPLPPKI